MGDLESAIGVQRNKPNNTVDNVVSPWPGHLVAASIWRVHQDGAKSPVSPTDSVAFEVAIFVQLTQ